ncbi:D-aminoacyl-tRNA deacylase [Saccharospirillum alexandrii]|uniref:D-aminoacyl-tRNA deacylase n=1 Tax=Saccharospirillum alexandrii TaxID=2448477 RepID=UPI0037368C6C
MKALIQRVTRAQVTVDNATVGAIDQGLLVLVGIDPDDGAPNIEKMAHRLLNYRVFADADGRMNLNVQQISGGVLLVPQFTLSADTRKGLRPSFTSAAAPEHGVAVFSSLVEAVKQRHERVETGQFGANMQVSLTNDGPVTFLLEH